VLCCPPYLDRPVGSLGGWQGARKILYGWGPGRAEHLEGINVAGGFADRYAAVQVEHLIDGHERGIAAVFD
jgi:hypothetical protein